MRTPPPTEKPGLLVVDDDPLIIDALGFVLAPEFEVFASSSRDACIEQMRTMTVPPPLALVDLGLPPRPHRPDEGFALIADLLAHSPTMKIFVLSGQNDETNARHARALGAMEFIAKPADAEAIRRLLLDALAFGGKAAEPAPQLIGESLPVQRLRTQIGQLADSPFPVLIEGESGSGKEIIATSLHEASSRRGRPYFALNCAAIAPTLVEPTLFGYARGAFTGATTAKSGYFDDVADGTLFLDEIGELPLDLQSKLLRVIENGEFQRVGETQSRRSRARIITATNRDLRREMKDGRFRTDLYHRLSVFTLDIPPLRDRGRDRLLLLDFFRDMYSASGDARFRLGDEAEQQWMTYVFPGNVRELRNIVIRLATKYPGQVVDTDALLAEFDTTAEPPPASGPALDPNALITAVTQEIQANPQFNLDVSLRRWEQAYIDAAQRLAHGNISQAARILGVNRTTLYNRMEALARNAAANH